MHSDCKSNVCKPGGINAQFTMTYYKGTRSVVANILTQCYGTWKLSKRIETEPPLPTAMRTMGVMEAIQCDLILAQMSRCDLYQF